MPPPWLAALQAGFGEALRTPLAAVAGQLESVAAVPQAWAAEGGGAAAAGVRLYNRQYWLRLFQAVQRDLPLVTLLLGAWRLNHVVQAWLRRCPPQDEDLGRLAAAFADFVLGAAAVDFAVPGGGPLALPLAVVAAAAKLDVAVRAAGRLGQGPRWRPAASEWAQLPQKQLVVAAGVAAVADDWGLVPLRQALERGERLGGVAVARQACRYYLVLPEQAAWAVVELAPAQAELYRLLAAYPLGEALALWEEGAAPGTLADAAQRWLAAGMQFGLWCGACEVRLPVIAGDEALFR